MILKFLSLQHMKSTAYYRLMLWNQAPGMGSQNLPVKRNALLFPDMHFNPQRLATTPPDVKARTRTQRLAYNYSSMKVMT